MSQPAPTPFLPRYLHGRLLVVALLLWALGAAFLLPAWDKLQPRWLEQEQQELLEPTVDTVTVRGTGPAVPPPGRLARLLDRVGYWLPVGLCVSCGSIMGVMGLACVARAYQARYAPSYNNWLLDGQPVAPVFALAAGHLRLLRPYPFAASAVAGRRAVAAAELTEVADDGSYVVLAGREKLFLPGVPADDVLTWAARHGLPCCRRPPVWTWLADPLNLDVARAGHDDDLQAAGITPREARQARRTLRWGWLLNLKWAEGDDWGDVATLTYSHHDILYLTGCSLLPRRRWYRRTMALALRAPAIPISPVS